MADSPARDTSPGDADIDGAALYSPTRKGAVPGWRGIATGIVLPFGLLCLAIAWPVTGLSQWAAATDDENHEGAGKHQVPFFPSASDGMRQGFVRVINRSHHSGEVEIVAIDDAGHEGGMVTLAIGAEETAHFNSEDLETGNTEKGLTGAAGSTDHDWRLRLSSDLEIEVLAYIRTEDGFLTSMHDTVPAVAMEHDSDANHHDEDDEGHGHGHDDDGHGHDDDSDEGHYDNNHRVAIFNPGSNTQQVSKLRITNPGHHDTHVRITGIDDHGDPSHGHVSLSIASGESRTFDAMELESGHQDFEGALEDGHGKWQLTVSSEEPVVVMSLLSSPTGHLTNLSTAPGRMPGETAAEVFHESISEPIVQARCVNCHVAGGQSAHTRLVFVPSSEHDHEATNFNVFREFLASDDHDGHDHGGQSHRELILNKIQGMYMHGGGVQVPADSEEFHDMERFLALLEAEIRAADDGHDHDH